MVKPQAHWLLIGTLAASIVEDAEIGIIVVDSTGRVAYANRAAEDLTGYTSETLYDLPNGVDDLTPPTVRSLHPSWRETFTSGGGPLTRWMGQQSTNVRLLTAEGVEIPVRIGLSRVMADTGRYVYVYISPRA